MSDIQKELARIQKELKAPKGQYNSFGKYKYRSCEDILEALKKVKGDCVLLLFDEVVEVGGRVYVKATAQLGFGASAVSVTAYAREPEDKKGMDASQITGTASSYARKYALNGLFLIDDTKDADTDEYQGKTQNVQPSTTIHDEAWDLFDKFKEGLTEKQRQWCMDCLNAGNSQDVIDKLKAKK